MFHNKTAIISITEKSKKYNEKSTNKKIQKDVKKLTKYINKRILNEAVNGKDSVSIPVRRYSFLYKCARYIYFPEAIIKVIKNLRDEDYVVKESKNYIIIFWS